MSFILDALRRAEAQRERNSVPGLHSQSAVTATTGHTAGRRGSWVVQLLAGISLLLLLALLLLLTLWWRTTAPDAAPVALAAPALPAMPAAASTPAIPASAATSAAGSSPASASVPPRQLSPAPAASAQTARARPLPAAPASAPALLRSVAELPEPWRGLVARLSFGGAVHSANAAQSFVMVGGLLVHEGDSVAQDITVERIGPRAAVLRAGPHRVEVAY